MATQIVMDQTGDTRHEFDPGNAEALARAERRFRELTGAGFTAALRTGPGEVTRIRSPTGFHRPRTPTTSTGDRFRAAGQECVVL